MKFQGKKDVHGAFSRFKSQWIVERYLEQFGIDFDQTFTAVVKEISFRVLFIVAYYDLDINQMDMKMAFFYKLIDQLVYGRFQKALKLPQIEV